MSSDLILGLRISVIGLSVTFLALGLVILVMVLLLRLFPDKSETGRKDVESAPAMPEDGDEQAMEELARNLAMHIVAASPSFLSKEHVPKEILDKEKEILLEQIKGDEKQKNKPENVIQKMIDGKLAKYYNENVLLDQEYMLSSPDGKKRNVKAVIEQFSKTNGSANIVLKNYLRYQVGENSQ